MATGVYHAAIELFAHCFQLFCQTENVMRLREAEVHAADWLKAWALQLENLIP